MLIPFVSPLGMMNNNLAIAVLDKVSAAIRDLCILAPAADCCIEGLCVIVRSASTFLFFMNQKQL